MNIEQQKALNTIIEGNNVFLTGAGGVGKSYTLSNVISWARDNGKKYAVTATTGSAAVLINGRTIHSYLGIGLGVKSAEQLACKVLAFKPTANKIKNLELLIIDEISMMDADLMNKIDELLKIIRKSNRAFGGVQVVFVGDFCQLQPPKGAYCFTSSSWKRADPKVIVLKQSMRQKDDTDFQELLNALRFGKCSDTIIQKLDTTKNNSFCGSVKPTMLYCRNVDVDHINEKNFQEQLKKETRVVIYKAKYSNALAESWCESCKIPKEFKLCVGCQVVCTWNIDLDGGIINGTRGIVKGMFDKSVVIELVNGRNVVIDYIKATNQDCEKCFVEYLPLKLAWALTVHKSQGMTLDCVVVNLSGVFACGQGYTALSRVRNMSSLQVHNVSKRCFKTDYDVLSFYENCNM
jgi:ATP-dependent DNA helicase PIF1